MKKVISIALALLMVAVMLPVMAMAEDDIALPAPVDGVIKLKNNVTLSSFAKIEGNMKLDLNGHTITCTKNWAIVVMQNGTLTVVDSSPAGTGAIVCTGGDETARSAIFGGDNTSIIIEGGHLKGVDYGIVLMGKDSSLTVNGGVIEGDGFGISGNGSLSNGVPEYPTTITINGGEIKGGDVGIYHPQVGKLTINNGEITGKTGVEIRAGELIVNGGTITATGDPTSTDPNGNGSTTVGAAIAVVQHTTKQHINVKINGGSFNGVSALYEANPQNNPTEATRNVFIVVTGGNFEGMVCKAEPKDGSSLGVMGGTFNSNVTDYVHASPTVKDENNNYYVGETAEAVLQSATSGTFTVVGADRDEDLNVNPGVTIVNNSGVTITVNDKEVPTGDTYTVPGAPIIIYTPDNEPAILSGANQVVAPGAAATFRIDEEYDRLLAVAVDGVTLDKSNYEAWSGSTYIKLLPKFMKTLSVGTHTLTAYFTSHTVSTTFTISEGAKNPATGANDFVGVAAAMAVISLLGAAAVIRKK